MGHVTIISISNLSRTYASGYQALKKVKPGIQAGEILALFGPGRTAKRMLMMLSGGIKRRLLSGKVPGAWADCGHGHGIAQGDVDPGTAVACLESDDYSH